jgi:23S rRNA (pseudouridine1915-N3)-methyltransferase
MNLHILAIGKKKTNYDDFIAEYQKRITAPYSFSLEIVPPTGIDHKDQSKTKEAEKIVAKLLPSDYVIVLDEHGKDFTTVKLSEHVEQLLTQGTKRVVFIIGGSYGLDQSVISRAHLVLKIGSLTLPHELVRLVLAEQLYRVTNLLSGGKYHHE